MAALQRVLISALLLAFASSPGVAAEVISNFDSQISIHLDGKITVEEAITVRSEGQKIKRGIYRDFPTTYRDRFGNTVRVAFKVLSVSRDGQTINHWIESINGGKRVYMGSKDRLIEPGRHTFLLAYETDRQIGFFDEFDELYWNVTGNGWVFPILSVKASVRLPDGAHMVQQTAYTGSVGAQGKDFRASLDANGNPFFTTTRTFMSGEGLTIAVAWPKGIVQAPTVEESASRIVEDNDRLKVALAAFVLVLAYYLIVWYRVGRDPEAGTIVPLFEPPKGMSPAASRFLMNMKFDDKAFSSAIVSLAVKGALNIRDGSSFTLTRNSSDDAVLSRGEKALAREIFSNRNAIELESENHLEIGRARDALEEALKSELEATHFSENFLYLMPGLVLSILAVVGIALLSPDLALVVFMAVWLSIWTYTCFRMIMKAVQKWRSGARIVAIGHFLFSVPFLIGEVFGLSLLASAVSLPAAIVMLFIALLAPLFQHLLKAPTLKGRKLLDRIEGFKLYLSVAEKDRFEFLHPPEVTPELFEKCLPYALALDVGHEWSERFAGNIANAGVEPARMSWYSGRSWDDRNPAGFHDRLNEGFSGSLSSAAMAPGSSSGSGGGGFSGGGGGGGGGGGF